MKVIFGQGNPGERYQNTRHNIGWTTVSAFARAQHVDFTHKPKFHAHIAELQHRGEKVLIVLPDTFYNEVGKSARAIMDFYKLSASDILVVHDDIALPWGTIRVRRSGSDAGNNGIKSYNAHIGDTYWRIRVGIQPLTQVSDTAAYVLGTLNTKERELLTLTLPEIIQQIQLFMNEVIAVHSVSLSTTSDA